MFLPFPDTSDVQNASVTYYKNDVSLACSFAYRSLARGCVFTFTVATKNGNVLETFYVLRNETSSQTAQQCNTTRNRISVYTAISVVDWQADGSEGRLNVPLQTIRVPQIDFLCPVKECKFWSQSLFPSHPLSLCCREVREKTTRQVTLVQLLVAHACQSRSQTQTNPSADRFHFHMRDTGSDPRWG